MGTSPPTIFKIIYKSGANKPADYLSRHPTNESKQKQEKMTEQYINFITQNSVPKAMTLQEIINATNADAALTARGVTRVLIGGGGIFIYSFSARRISFEFLCF
jgi:riboflavin biosynthesis pyrimidine reductase